MSTIKSGLVVGLIGALTVPALALATDDHPPLRLPTATTAAPQPASTAPAEATQPVPPAAASTAPSPALALSPTSLDPPNVKPAAAPQTDTDPKAGVSATDTASANAGRDTVTSQAEREAAREIAQLQIQEAILQHKIKVAQQRKKLMELGGGGSHYGDVTPYVSSLYGTRGHLTAVLMYPNGGALTVRAGTILPNGAVVKRVSDGGVLVAHHGETTHLMFGGANAPSGSADIRREHSPRGRSSAGPDTPNP